MRNGSPLALLALTCAAIAGAAQPVHTLKVDLAPKIDIAAQKRERFAVDVSHAASVQSAGNWERAAGVSTWRYSVRIPGAVSLSFHADSFELPAGAHLVATDAGGARAVYSPADGADRQLWSRTQRGDTLHLELRVPTLEERNLRFSIAALHAGYRVLGGGGADHPHFRKLTENARAASALAACSRSFACHETAANAANGDATAAIVIGGVALCSATLVNNLRNDGTPYLLSARHCQVPSGGVVVYWDAVTSCGAALGSVYDTQTPALTSSVRTAFEQQDIWLMQLSSAVNALTPHFAAWDATGGAFVGGYSPHHALGRSRQYTEWFGQAITQTLPASVLGTGYEGVFWGVVNSVGNVGSGASGGGLFDMNHRLVGVASLAYIDGAGEGVCPAASPSAPSTTTATALYNSLAAVWESTSDATSRTNPVTLRSVLDPDNTGVRVSNTFTWLEGVTLRTDQLYGSTGTPVTLTWTGGAATSCTGAGGNAGDGWAGPKAANGSFRLTSYAAGVTNYSISCSDGARIGANGVQVRWQSSGIASTFLGTESSSGSLGGTARISWRSSEPACTASGGVAGDGWAGLKAGFGTQDVPLTQTGVITYTLSCGDGAANMVRTTQVEVFGPSARLEADTTSVRINNVINLQQSSSGASCARTGGAPGDGWAGSTSNFPRTVTSAVAGTFTYVLTCSGGPVPAIASVDLTFTEAAPAVTLTASKPSAEVIFEGPIGDLGPPERHKIEFTWVSNIAPCRMTYDGPGDADGNVHYGTVNSGRAKFISVQTVAGTYVYTVTCTSADGLIASHSISVQFVPQAPRLTLETAEHIAANEPFGIAWSSTVTPCVATGGTAGDGWAGAKSTRAGMEMLTLVTPGTYTYEMTCGSGPEVASDVAEVTLAAPAVLLEPHDTETLVGHGVIIRWNATIGPCVMSNHPTAEFPARGGNVVVSQTPATVDLTIRCGSASTTFVETSTRIVFRALPVVDIVASPSIANVNETVTLSWTSAGATSCAVPGTGSTEWGGALPTSGSRVVSRSFPTTAGFYIDCGGVIDAAVVEWRGVATSPPTISGPAVTLTINNASRVAGEAVTVTWSSSRAALCRGSQGVNGDGWAGVLPTSGSRAITVNAAGTYNWDITCEGAPPAASARVSATYTAAPAPPSSGSSSGGGSSSGSGGGGGGSLDWLMVAFLGSLLAYSSARRRRVDR